MAQFVDIDTAKEFMKEALEKVSAQELDQICADLERKSQFFQDKLGKERVDHLTEEELRSVLQRIFSVRRKRNKLLQVHSAPRLLGWISQLLYGEADVARRMEAFCNQLTDVDETIRYDLASELLHFTMPENYWLWTRWIWDPNTQTGSLPLVITEDYDLRANGIGQTYLRLGKALSFVRHVGEAAGFDVISNGPFGVDAYLCSVYVVYVYTVLRMRMTQEFNKVMPGLAEFSRRLLGIYKMED